MFQIWETKMINRFIVVVLGPVLAYIAVRFGEDAAKIHEALATLTFMVAFVLVCIGTWATIHMIADDGMRFYSMMGGASLTVFNLVCSSVLFGIVVKPFTYFGIYPWNWISGWALFPVIFLFLLLLFFANILVKEKKEV